jgi:hypothetical protein
MTTRKYRRAGEPALDGNSAVLPQQNRGPVDQDFNRAIGVPLRNVREGAIDNSRVVASLDRKRLGADFWGGAGTSIRGVFDEETRRKPLAFAADAVRYGI